MPPIWSASSLTVIGYGAFASTGLTEIYIPSSVTVVGESAFYGCGSLSNATVMNYDVSLEYSDFSSCSGLVLHGWSGSPA